MPSCTLHVNAANMAELMAEADLFIGAGGSTTWERCCLGLPSLVIAVADNQVATTSCCAEQGMCLYLGESAQVTEEIIAAALSVLLRTSETLRSFARESMRLVDGNGIRRVVSRLLPPVIALRRATMDDCDAVHAWRNHEETRRFIFNPDPVPIEVHREWYRRALLNPQKIILIGESEGKPVGVLRFDWDGVKASISVFLVPEIPGKGIGSELIRTGSRWIKENLPGVLVINAEVLPENCLSRKALASAGYEEKYVLMRKLLH
jgi:RimJ/RimL family protein N-acetyltransferase